MTLAIILAAMSVGSHCAAATIAKFGNVECAGDYQHHLQGVCTNESAARDRVRTGAEWSHADRGRACGSRLLADQIRPLLHTNSHP